MNEAQNGEYAIPTVTSLDGLVSLVTSRDCGSDEELYVRWSKGPAVDLASDDQAAQSSRDGLTGVPLPGLSVSPLRVEPWWGNRSLRLWLARRLYDYRHLKQLRGPGVRAWVLRGEERGRGPDNEPLVECRQPVAWVTESALRECEQLITEQNSEEWGPLDRRD